MTLFESSFPIQHHKACASRMINASNENQICYSCIQPCFFAHECNPHDINVTQHVAHVSAQIFCNVYRRCIDRTQSACKQATPCLYTSFFLQAEGQDVAGCEQQETYLLNVNNMTSITQVMITRLPVAQRVFHTRFAKTIRIPRHHRIALRATATQRTTTCFTASFTTICRNI